MSLLAASLEIQRAVYARLSSDGPLTALIGIGRVYDDVPADASFPYLTLGDAAARDWSTGTSAGSEHAVTIEAWSRSAGRTEIKQMLASVEAALTGTPLTVAGYRPVLLRAESASTQIERDGITYRGTLRLRLLVEPL